MDKSPARLTPPLLACKIGEEKRPANPLEVPPKLAELVLSHQTTKMQANLLSRREDIVLREDALTVAIDAALSIHTMATNRSDPGWVRIVPDRDLSVRPISCLHLRDSPKASEGNEFFPFEFVIRDEKMFDFKQLFWQFVQRSNLPVAARMHSYSNEAITAFLLATLLLLLCLDARRELSFLLSSASFLERSARTEILWIYSSSWMHRLLWVMSSKRAWSRLFSRAQFEKACFRVEIELVSTIA